MNMSKGWSVKMKSSPSERMEDMKTRLLVTMIEEQVSVQWERNDNQYPPVVRFLITVKEETRHQCNSDWYLWGVN